MPTPEYTQENLLKKVHIGNTDYYFKDEDLRNFVESFGTAVEKDAVNVLDDTGTDLPTEAAVADYVDDIKTNYIDPKASVALGSDEELIFNYIPATPSNVTIHFASENPYQDYSALNITMGSVPNDITVPYGTSYDEANIPIPDYNYGGGHGSACTFYWVIDPSEVEDGDGTRIATESDWTTYSDPILNNITAYPYFWTGDIS